MDIVPLGPLRCTSMLWQPTAGSWTLTVICKATYRLAPEMSPLHEEQEPPNEEDSHWDDDPNRSLSAPSDLVPFKARADVLLVGSAFAPGHRAVRSLVVRLSVGEVNKSIEVFGKRAWTQGGQLQEGPGFTSMPLVYERAAGGPETWNPVGMRLDAAPDANGNVALPNLQPPGVKLGRRGDCVSPVGFGPIAPAWGIRTERLGRHRGSFSAAAWRDAPVPEDLDPACFNAAPKDQQVEALRVDERIELENLHPEYPRLVTNLPGVRPRVFAEKAGEAPQEVGMRCDTLWIDTGRGICALVWRGHVPVEGRAQRGRVLVAMEEWGQRVGWAEVARMARGRPERSGGEGDEEAADGVETLQTAPLGVKDAGGETMPLSPDVVRRAAMPFPAATRGEEASRREAPKDDVLPFVAARAGGGELPPEAQRAAPVAPPPMVRAPVSSEPIAPPITASPWAVGAQRAAGPSVGQIAAFSPHVPPPPVARSAAGGADAGSGATPRERGAKIGEWRALTPPSEVRPPEAGVPGGGRTGKEVVLGGALAASNAAAGSANVGAVKPVEVAHKPAAEPVRDKPREVLELIWYDPAALPRIRRNPAWKKITAELKPRPSDDDFDGGLPPEQMKVAKDKRDVFGVLARGEVQDMAGILRAMGMAILDDGSFVAPYVLTEGVLDFPFDEVETLKAMLVAVAPFVAGDKKLRETVDLANEFIKTPGFERARGMAEGLIARTNTVFEQGNRGVSTGYLEAQVEPMLLEGKCYQKRSVGGRIWLEARYLIPKSNEQIKVHLPHDPEIEHPPSFKARTLSEIKPQPHHNQAHLIMRLVAMANITNWHSIYLLK